MLEMHVGLIGGPAGVLMDHGASWGPFTTASSSVLMATRHRRGTTAEGLTVFLDELSSDGDQ